MSKLIMIIISFVVSIQITNSIVLPFTIGAMGSGALFAFIVYPIVFTITMIIVSFGTFSLFSYFFKENNTRD